MVARIGAPSAVTSTIRPLHDQVGASETFCLTITVTVVVSLGSFIVKDFRSLLAATGPAEPG